MEMYYVQTTYIDVIRRVECTGYL